MSNNNNNPLTSKRKKNRRSRRSKNTNSAPLASAKSMRNQTARIQRSSTNSYRIKKSEFIGSVTDAASFTVTGHSLNPGISGTFPWLSVIAADWEEYTFHYLEFEYVSRAPATITSSVILAPDYDALDAPPTTEAVLTAYQDAVEDSAWKNIRCFLNKASMFPNGGFKYVRTVAVAGDLKTYDAGNFFYSVDGAGTTVIGKLWVHYDVEFRTPHIAPSLPISTSCSSWGINSNTNLVSGVNLKPNWTREFVNPLGITYIGGTGDFDLPRGVYLILLDLVFKDDTGGASALIEVSYELNHIPTIPIATLSTAEFVPAAGQWLYPMHLQAVISSDGSDSFDVVVQLTTASGGALSLPQYNNRITFLLI